VGGVPLGQRAAPGQKHVQLCVRRGVHGRVAEGDLDLEVARDLVEERHRFAAELPGGALQPGELAADELGAVGRQVGDVELAQQRPGLVAQPLRSRRRLGLHLGPDPLVAGVGIDEAGLQPVEPQPQLHVLQGDVGRGGRHDR
jgi:hypothetical protein